ncbi:DUF3747 domain-containing protein [Trichothermofontia sp.]
MKPLFRFGLAVLTATLVGTTGGIRAVNAAVFGQQEVDQSKLIAIAAPRGNTGVYQLLILEQTSVQRPCWAESGSNPIRVDPLLLTFNFTGICDRKTDSNGFSIRMGGEDLALSYSLRVVRTDRDLILIGYPNRDRNAPVIEIGRAYGVAPGEFAKIILNPNWRFAKRTYGGKTLGHIYLTTDASLAEIAATTAPPDLTPSLPGRNTAPTAFPETPVPHVTAGETVPEGIPPISIEWKKPATSVTETRPGAEVSPATRPPATSPTLIEVETSVSTPPEAALTTPTLATPSDALQVPKSDQEFVVPTREATPTLW